MKINMNNKEAKLRAIHKTGKALIPLVGTAEGDFTQMDTSHTIIVNYRNKI